MNKVISFSENKEYSEYQMRLIAYNIIDYSIKEAYKISEGINPDHIYTEIGDRFYCSFDNLGLKNTIIQTVKLNTAFDVESHDNYIYNIKDFIKTYGLNSDMYKISVYIFCLLHECGHMVYNQYFKDRLKNNFDMYMALRGNVDSAIHMALSRNIDDADYDCMFDYCYNPDEALATQYTYQHFKKVLDMLIYRGFIGGPVYE